MFNDDKYSSIAIVVLLGIFLQLILIVAGERDTPHKAVVEFARSYYQLDPSMAERICEQRRRIDDVDMVNQYILTVLKDARKRGFDLKYMRTKLYHIETETSIKDDSSAEVHLTALGGSGINPVFAYVGKLFGFSKPRKVEQTYNVVKEGGKWKVCGNLFSRLES